MLDDESTPTPDVTSEDTQSDEPTTEAQPAKKAPAKKTATRKTAAKKTPAKSTAKTAKKTAAKKTAGKKASSKQAAAEELETVEQAAAEADAPAADATVSDTTDADTPGAEAPAGEIPVAETPAAPAGAADEESGPPAPVVLFQPPQPQKASGRPSARQAEQPQPEPAEKDQQDALGQDEADTDTDGEGGQRRRRRRGGRRRRKNGEDEDTATGTDSVEPAPGTAERGRDEPSKGEAKAGQGKPGKGDQADKGAGKGPDKGADKGPDKGRAGDSEAAEKQASGTTRRRRRRRRQGEDDNGATDDPQNTVVRVREPRPTTDDEISGVTGSTRLEAKKQRRREGREAGRRRAPIVSEAEFLARREAVDRVMVVRQRDDVTQIGVLEDDVLVEHYVARESQTSLIGNVYLGRVQNVLPSMEAAFIDIGKGRNAVLYAGEVNWSVLGKDGQPRRIETALKSGQTVLVQVTKDPVGHKGARLTSQVSLPGRYLVYLPDGQTSGISRKLPDTERNRLKNLLKEILPEDAGVIIRTAAEGASEDELRRDVSRLTARWEDIEKKVAGGQAPQLLYGEPDLMIKVVRDLFTEDFKKLVISGDDAWDMIEGYVGHVAPDLMDRVERWNGDDDVFASHRIDEQIAKALERKVWLPSGGSLVIDRTEAMTVVDVNTGKFTGSGGNLEETVTKNNLEAAEEIVRQLRVRDIGGIIVVDFIDMVLESNRDLVLRRLIECLGRDRTRHQVAEITSLGLVQMTRKRIGTGLLEAFSEPCESCHGRGLHTHLEPVEPKKPKPDSDDSGRSSRRSRRGGEGGDKQGKKPESKPESKQPEPKRDSEQEPKPGSKQEPKPGSRRDRREPEPQPATPDATPEPAVPDAASDRAAPDAAPERAAPESEPAAVPRPAQEAPAPGSTDGTGPGEGARPAASTGRRRRRAASRPAGPPQQHPVDAG